MDQKIVDKIGWFASIMGIIMFGSYIDQIRLNISGQPGSIILPIATVINGISWVTYGSLKPRVDWPIVLSNVVAIVLGAVTAVTAVMAA